MCVWESFLRYSQCVFYIDNEAARGAMIAGSTPSELGSLLIKEFTLKEMQCQVKVWFARVPTSSNLADHPSRLETAELTALGVSRATFQWDTLLEQLRRFRSDEWGEKETGSDLSPLL